MSAQTTEQKKDEFRKYLEKSGIVDQLTRVLVGLYEQPEKPTNAIEYIKKFLGSPSETEVETVQKENNELKDRIADKEKKLKELEIELAKAKEAQNA